MGTNPTRLILTRHGSWKIGTFCLITQVLFNKIQNCKQGDCFVQAYVDEFYRLLSLNELHETETFAHNHYFLHAVISSALKVEAFLDHHPPRNQPTNRSTSSRTPFTYNPPPSYLDPVTSHPPPPTQNDPSSSSASNPFTRSSLDKCFKYGKFGHRSHEYCSHVALVTPDAPHGDDDAFDTVDGCSSSFWKCG